MKVAIIIPTYNEKENIRPLIDRIEAISQSLTEDQVEILVVDDSSPDGTGQIVKELAEDNPRLHLLSRDKKEGLGAAYVAGMSYALEKLGAEVIFEMDGDFSHDPKLIPVFLDQIRKGADLVIGSRYIPGGSTPTDWSLKRKLISAVGNQGIRLTLNHRDVHEWSSGYRAIKKWVVETVKDGVIRFPGYTFQVAFLHKAIHAGARVVETPLKFVDRRFGKSKFPTFRYINNTVIYVFRSRLNEFLGSVFFKFCVVGSIGFVINAVGLEVFVKLGLTPSLATVLGAEIAIVSNFSWNNWWTFGHRRLTVSQLPGKFFQFNLTSSGAIVIQYLVLKTGEVLMGVTRFKSGINERMPFAWYHLFFLVAVGLGLIWNFFFYSRVIWRPKDDSS